MTLRLLPESLVNRIAAGEVIERPAAAVKELVENALDAGASRVEIVLREGGQALIRVTDDGRGMTAEELKLAIQRHATSKLPDDDLYNIHSFGFRGEALPSIGSVARLTIMSRARGSDEAWQIQVDGGAVAPLKPASLAEGTQIEVRDLFFATPARLKFLKSPRTEADAAREAVERLAMAYPHVDFTLQEDDRRPVRFAACGGDRGARLRDALGANFMANAAPVSATREGMSLSGYAGLPTWNRPTTREQHLFVNNRPVRDKTLMAAVRGAYGDVLPSGRHPAVALFLELPVVDVDQNVHPTKAEVRFRDAARVRGLIVVALREALQSSAQFTTSALAPQALAMMQPVSASAAPMRFSEHVPVSSWATALPPAARAAEVIELPEAVGRLGAAIAQIHNTFILAQTTDSLVIVDQHAAHERIVYERLKEARANRKIERQMLLIPDVIELEERATQRLLASAETLAEVGLTIEAFGDGAILVREIPALLTSADMKALLGDLAEELAEHDHSSALRDKMEHLCATIACHGSIRAGRVMKIEEMNALLRQMESTPNSAQCSHGRPTYVELKREALEKLFERR